MAWQAYNAMNLEDYADTRLREAVAEMSKDPSMSNRAVVRKCLKDYQRRLDAVISAVRACETGCSWDSSKD